MITCEDIKIYLDRYIDKFKSSGISISWDGYEDEPFYSSYIFNCDGNEIGYMGVEQIDKVESIDDLMLDISIPVELRIISTIKYKKNDGEWTNITSTTGGTQINVTSGDTVQFKGDNLAYANMDNGGGWINLFSGTTAEFNVKGNIMSLIDSDDFETLDTLTCAATFTGLFGSCTGLTSAENLILPATTLVVSCYQSMFAGCTNLTTAPALPATTLAMACYTGMLAICTSLTTAPALPATTLADGCYVSMFEGCTNLNYIKAMFTTTPSTTYTQNWVDGVSSTGTFVKNSAAQWDVTGADGIPSGWTVETA